MAHPWTPCTLFSGLRGNLHCPSTHLSLGTPQKSLPLPTLLQSHRAQIQARRQAHLQSRLFNRSERKHHPRPITHHSSLLEDPTHLDPMVLRVRTLRSHHRLFHRASDQTDLMSLGSMALPVLTRRSHRHLFLRASGQMDLTFMDPMVLPARTRQNRHRLFLRGSH